MANEITFSGKQPEEKVNGLRAAAKDLLADPRRLRLIVAVVSVSQAIDDFEKNVTRPQVKIRHVELVPEKSIAAVTKVLNTAHSSRTGLAQLPLEVGGEFQLELDDLADDSFAESLEADRGPGADLDTGSEWPGEEGQA